MRYQIERNKIIRNGILELEQMHSAMHKDCKDQGSDTCPTWNAIHGLKKLLTDQPSPESKPSIPPGMENFTAIEIGTDHDLTGRSETYQAHSLKEAAGNLLYTRKLKDGNVRMGSTGQVVFCSDGTSWCIRREA